MSGVLSRVELVKEEVAIRERLGLLQRETTTLQERLQKIAVLRSVATNLDPEKLRVASHVLEVYGKHNGHCPDIFSEAAADLVSGGKRLAESYFGAKHYSGWYYQREDHSYGRGPAYGTVAFSIGFRRWSTDEGSTRKRDLTPEQVDACLYLLDAVRDELITGRQIDAIVQEYSKKAEADQCA